MVLRASPPVRAGSAISKRGQRPPSDEVSMGSLSGGEKEIDSGLFSEVLAPPTGGKYDGGKDVDCGIRHPFMKLG